MGFDIEGARRAGYSDQEIADHLGAQSNFDTASARSAGYTDTDIIGHLGATSAAPAEPAEPAEPAALPSSLGSAVSAGLRSSRVSAPSRNTVPEFDGDSGMSASLSSAFDRIAPAVPHDNDMKPLGPYVPESTAGRVRLPEIPVMGEHGGARTMMDAPARGATWEDVRTDILPTIGARNALKVIGAQEMFAQSDAKKEFWQAMVIPDAVKEWQAINAGKDYEDRINLSDMPIIQESAARAGMRPDNFTYGWQDLIKKSPQELDAIKEQARARIAPEQARLDDLKAQRTLAGQVMQEARPNFDNEFGLKALAFDAAVNLPDTVTGVGIGAVAGPVAGLTALGGSVATEQYASLLNEGYSHEKALFGTALGTIAEIAPETKVIDFIRRTPLGKGIIKKLIGAGFEEGISEQLTEAMQIGIDMGVLDKEMSITEAVTRVTRAGILGAITGAPFGALPSQPQEPQGLDIPAEFLSTENTQLEDPLAAVQRSYGDALAPATGPEATAEQPTPTMAELLTAVTQAAGAVPQAPGASEPPPEKEPEPDTMAAPPVSGSPPPGPTSKASAPIEEPDQGAASQPPAADPRAGTYDVTDAPTSEGPKPERVQLVVEPDGTGFLKRGSEKIDVSAQLKTGRSAEQIISTYVSATQSPANVSRVAGKKPKAGKQTTVPTAPVSSEPAASPVPPAPSVSTPAPAPQADTVSTTAQEPPAGEAASNEPDHWTNKSVAGEMPAADFARELQAQIARPGRDQNPDEFFPESAPQHVNNATVSLNKAAKWYEHYERLTKAIPLEQQDPAFRAAIQKSAQEVEAATNAYELQNAAAGLAYNLSGAASKLARITPEGKKAVEKARKAAEKTEKKAAQKAAKKAAKAAAAAPTEKTAEPTVEEPVAEPDEEVVELDTDVGTAAAEEADTTTAEEPTSHMAPPSETPGRVRKRKRGTLAEETDGYDVQEEEFDEEQFAKLFGPKSGDGLRLESQREGAPATIAGGQAQDGWREATRVRSSGTPGRPGAAQAVWRGSDQPLTAKDFLFARMGYNTAKPTAALGVFFTESKAEAARYGTPRQYYLDVRNPVYLTVTPHSKHKLLPPFDSPEDAYAFNRKLKAQGFDGIVLLNKHSDPNANNWVLPLEPDQVIEKAEADRAAPAKQALKDTAEARTTGKAPTGQAPGTAASQPQDPLQRIAAKQAAAIRAKQEGQKTPPLAPKRDQELGRSTFDDLWRDLFFPPGVNPDEISPESWARREEHLRRIQLKPLPEQMRLAQARLKHYYDFKDIRLDPDLSPREALDVMLDAYANLQRMANVTGQPRQAMGFNGKLVLHLAHSLGNKGTRGKFTWDFASGFEGATLSLARQADSFAHEWIHALDLNLLMRYFKKEELGVSGAANYLRNPLNELPPNIRESFTRLMAAIFVTDDASANEIARLSLVALAQGEQVAKAEAALKRTQDIIKKEAEREAQAVEHENNAKKEKDAFRAASLRKSAATLRQRTNRAHAEIKGLRAAWEKAKIALAKTQAETVNILKTKATNLHKNSAFVDQLLGKQYFSIPAEMLARAGESWMGNRIGAQVGMEVLSGTAGFYNDNSDRMMQLIYPDFADRERIFQRFDDLFAALGEDQYFSGDTAAAKIPGDTNYSKELYQEALKDPLVNRFRKVYERKKKEFVAVMMNLGGMARSTVQKDSWTGAITDFNKAVKAFFMMEMFAITGRAQSHIEMYKHLPKVQQLLRKLYSKLATNPGAREEEQGFTAQEDIERYVNRKNEAVDLIIRQNNINKADPQVMKQLFQEYTRPNEELRHQLQTHQKFLKDRLASIQGDRNKGGEAASIRRYMERINKILAMAPMPANPTNNIQKAAKQLRELSDELYKANRKAGINLGYVSNYMNRTLNREAIEEKGDEFIEQATLVYQIENAINQQKLQRELAEVQNDIKAGDAALKRDLKEPPKAIAARKRLPELKKELAELELANPAEQADAYYSQIRDPDSGFGPDAKSPETKYTKARVLGPAADVFLADFYEQDVVKSLKKSISTTAYRVAYAERFGNDPAELKAQLKELTAAGMKPEDKPLLIDAIKVAFGQTGNFTSTADTIGNWIKALTLFKMLAKAVFNNIPEPLNAASVTGRSKDGFKAIAFSYLPILIRGNRRELRLCLELMGHTASAANAELTANRSGLDYQEGTRLQALSTTFGKVTGVQPITELGNFGVGVTMMDYTNFIATSWQEGDADQKAEALAVMNEFGVPANLRDKFAAFVRSMPKGRPTVDMLTSAGNQQMKDIYGGVLYRMVRYTIQKSHRVDKSRAAFGRVSRFVMTLTNFPMSYQRNIIVREKNLFQRGKGIRGKSALVAKVLYHSGIITMLVMLARMAYEYWDDPEREEKKKKPEDFDAVNATMAFLEAYDRTGRTGLVTILLNQAFKFKFNRPASATAVGAVPAFHLNNLDLILKGFAPGADRNSPNTLRDERKAWGAIYDEAMMLSTPLMAGLRMTGPVGWIANSKLNSRGYKEAFTNLMAPPTVYEKAYEARAAERAEDAEDVDPDEKAADDADKREELELEYGQ